MINLDKYTSDLIEKDGIHFSKKNSKVSYPESGNEKCFQIEQNSFWFSHRNNCIVEAVLKYCPKNIFFDVGGGNGFVAQGLESKGVSTVLVEPGMQGCLNAKKRNIENVICSTLEDALFYNNSIPAIGLFDVVEHIENDVEFLIKVHNLLVDNGFVFITVPAYNMLWSNEDEQAGHYRRYTRKALEEKLKNVGFKIEYSTYIFSILTIAVFLFRVVPSKLGLSKKSNNLDKHKKQHESKKGLVDKALSWIWEMELDKIRKGKIIPIGGSCFLIARKAGG